MRVIFVLCLNAIIRLPTGGAPTRRPAKNKNKTDVYLPLIGPSLLLHTWYCCIWVLYLVSINSRIETSSVFYVLVPPGVEEDNRRQQQAVERRSRSFFSDDRRPEAGYHNGGAALYIMDMFKIFMNNILYPLVTTD